MDDVLVLIPLKGFDLSKQRLRLEGYPRPDLLMRHLAEGVIRACAPRRCVVVCEEPDVALWALRRGAQVWLNRATGLNDALTRARTGLRDRAHVLLVVHGDLASPTGLDTLDLSAPVTIVTDRHGRGTNALGLHREVEFTFEFGEDSAGRHRDQALARGLAHHVLEHSSWSLDIDTMDDLAQTADEGGFLTPLA
ncbi:MAG: hypothetical protein HKL87_06925 [Acidimicrobiaceae bacterium]|nr:hypothetical protein [Acidimicrobiaceae bacterium]